MAKRDKITSWLGEPIKTLEGLRVHGGLIKPKTASGTPHVWFVIKQDRDDKRWRMSETLAYADSVHVKFVPKAPKK